MPKLTKELAGDNTLTISVRYDRDYHKVVEVVEHGTDDFRHVHYAGVSFGLAIVEANYVLEEEEKLAGVEHDRFDFEIAWDALVAQEKTL